MSEKTIRSGRNNPCPICGRTKDEDCGWDSEKFFCHSNIECTDVPGYGYRGKTKDGLWGIYIKEEVWQKPPRPKGRKEYVYQSRNGDPLVKVTRVDDGHSRQFYQSCWTGKRWEKGVPDSIKAQVPIYRYKDVQGAIAQGRIIFMVEGEGCADALWTIGIAATTTLGGSKKYHSYGNYAQDLRAKQLVLCPDRDKVGVAHMEDIAQDFPDAQWCYPLPQSRIWQDLPDSGGYDIADWIGERAGLDDIFNAVSAKRKFEQSTSDQSKKEFKEEDLIRRIVEIRRMGDGVKQWFGWTRLTKESGHGYRELERLALALEDRQEFKPVDGLNFLANTPDDFPYLIEGLIVLGINMLVYADSGVGKSLLFYNIARAIATGENWSGFEVDQGRVLIIQTDEPSVITKRRLKRMGFNTTQSGLWYVEQNWQFSQMGQLERWIVEHKPKFVLVDCLTTSNRNAVSEENDVGYSLAQTDLMKLADRYQCTIVTLHHENKMGDMRGSTALRAHVSEVWQLRKPTSDEASMAALSDLNRIVDIKKTRAELFGKYVLQFNPDNYDWMYLGNFGDLCPARNDNSPKPIISKRETACKPAILHYLKEQSEGGGWYSVGKITEAVNKAERTVQRELMRLFDQGILDRQTESANESSGRPVYLFRYRRSPSQDLSDGNSKPSQGEGSELTSQLIFSDVNSEGDGNYDANGGNDGNPTNSQSAFPATPSNSDNYRHINAKNEHELNYRHFENGCDGNSKPSQGEGSELTSFKPSEGDLTDANPDEDWEDQVEDL